MHQFIETERSSRSSATSALQRAQAKNGSSIASQRPASTVGLAGLSSFAKAFKLWITLVMAEIALMESAFNVWCNLITVIILQ